MPARHHSKATRLAATFLARLASPEVAAATFRVDVRTVRGWQSGAVELPEDQWEAIHAVLGARAGEMAATGQTSGLVATMTALGIASRNVRYQQLIERREARRAGEQAMEETEPDPVKEALDALRDDQQQLIADSINYVMHERSVMAATGDSAAITGAYEPASDVVLGGDDPLLAFIAWVAGLTEDQVAVERESVSKSFQAMTDKLEQHAMAERKAEPPQPIPDAPTAAPVSPQPPQPKLRVVDDAGEPWQWQPYRRFDL